LYLLLSGGTQTGTLDYNGGHIGVRLLATIFSGKVYSMSPGKCPTCGFQLALKNERLPYGKTVNRGWVDGHIEIETVDWVKILYCYQCGETQNPPSGETPNPPKITHPKIPPVIKTVPGRIVWMIGGVLIGGVIGAFIAPGVSLILCGVGFFLGDKLYQRAIKP